MPKNLEDIELRSEEVQEILNRVPSWMIRYGSILFFVLILSLLWLSWFIKYPDVIYSEAIITTKIPPQKEYSRSTGKISHLLVNNNESVVRNNPIAILENSANYEDVFFLKAVMDSVQIQKDNFYFPIESFPILILGDIETDFSVFQNNYILYKLNKELKPYANEEVANKITESELQDRLILLESQRDINKNELFLKENEFRRYETLFKKGVISNQEYENKQLEYLQANKNLKNLSLSISQLRESISNARRNTRENIINKNTEELRLLKTVLQSYNQLKKSIRDWELQYAFISNLDGKVSFINVWDENQTVNVGDFLFSIVPDKNNRYLAKLRTPSQNFGKVKVGQQVNIRLDNFPDEEFGIISGEIANISLMPDNDGFYVLDVTLPDKLITSYGREILFTQEMRGTAEIITDDLRLIERFFYQFKEIISRRQ